MTDEETRLVQQHVNDYLIKERGVNIVNLQGFEDLVKHVQIVVRSVAEDDLKVVTAMCLCGPESGGIPPDALRSELLKITRDEVWDVSTRLDRIMGLVIAYGCGKWRTIGEGSGGWQDRWKPALDWVTHWVWSWMKASAAWLYFDIQSIKTSRDR
ncbi:MAG: hypothetical protein HY731_04005 [Candidatus Tectomicrobia bacterium]|nr:hypothetical protein [Candidatus Tectomicrobia bacterium]